MNIKKPNNCLNCKAKAELVRFGGGLYQCRCTGCGSLGRLTPYKSDAVKHWNEEHRPEPETLPENVGFVSISADEYQELQVLRQSVATAIAELTKVDFAHPGEFGHILEILKSAQNGSKANH